MDHSIRLEDNGLSDLPDLIPQLKHVEYFKPLRAVITAACIADLAKHSSVVLKE